MVNVWANAPDVPVLVCHDARLHGRNEVNEVGSETPDGQRGWHLGVRFASLEELASRLEQLELPWWIGMPPSERARAETPLYFGPRPSRRMRPGELHRLAINAHGNWDTVFIAGEHDEDGALTPERVNGRDRARLGRIGRMLSPHAFVFLMSCRTVPADLDNPRLLMALSGVWPGRHVVGYPTTLYQPGGELYRGGGCSEPGARDTDHTEHVPPSRQGEVFGRRWRTVSRNYEVGLPWADERSPHAMVVRDGLIVSYGGQRFMPWDSPPWRARPAGGSR